MLTNARGVAQECSGPCARAAGIPLRILNWNVEGLLGKVCEADFMQYVSEFDIICFTETFLDRTDPLDCFPDFLQFPSPAVKLSRHGRSSGGVLVLVKRAWRKYVSVLDLSQDNMVWLKIDRTVFSCEKHVILCCTYVCPYDSPYYRQAHVAVTSGIYSVEQCLLNFIQQFDQSCCYMLCGDFNARTGNFNALSHDDDGDTITFVQTELCEYRQSEDRTVNAFGRLLLEMCAECDLRILNGACRDEEGHFTYVCAAGCSSVDYYICSKELADQDIELHVNNCRLNCRCVLKKISLIAKNNYL